MKKMILISIAIVAFACSSNDDGKEVTCENKLWSLTNVGGQYFATYGPTAAEAGTIEVNLATYEYYSDLGVTTNGSICWDGTQD